MSFSWVAVAVVSAIGVGTVANQTMSKPMASHVKASPGAFQSSASDSQAMVDKAVVFASTAKSVGAFAGSKAWTVLASDAGHPSALSGASAQPAAWRAEWVAGALVVCMPGAPARALGVIETNISGVTAKNSGC